jgi:hypothetical protein
MMNLKTLYFLLLPLFLFSQSAKNITFRFAPNRKPSTGTIGVLGMENKKAFAIFVNETLPNNSKLYFNTIQFETTNFNKNNSKIFLCLYENKSGIPGELLKNGKILVHVPLKKTNITADLSELKLNVPADGYFIGFEWVLSEKNKIYGAAETTNYPYNPAIKGLSKGKYEMFVFKQKWETAENNLVSSLYFEVTYLP